MTTVHEGYLQDSEGCMFAYKEWQSGSMKTSVTSSLDESWLNWIWLVIFGLTKIFLTFGADTVGKKTQTAPGHVFITKT